MVMERANIFPQGILDIHQGTKYIYEQVQCVNLDNCLLLFEGFQYILYIKVRTTPTHTKSGTFAKELTLLYIWQIYLP